MPNLTLTHLRTDGEVCNIDLKSFNLQSKTVFLSNTELEFEKCRKLILSWKVVPHTIINYSSQGHALKSGPQRLTKGVGRGCQGEQLCNIYV